MKKYIIRLGDTMNVISQRTGVKLSLLMAANPQITDVNQLSPGQTIVIPELGKPTSVTAKPSLTNHTPESVYPSHAKMTGGQPKSHGPIGQSKAHVYFGYVWPHVVAVGETWETISRKYHVSMSKLMHLNPKYVNGRQPKVGKVVFIPSTNKPKGAKKTKQHRNTEVERSETPQAQGPVKAQHVLPTLQAPESFETAYEESSSLLSSWDEWDSTVQYQAHSSSGQPLVGTTQLVDTFEFQNIDVDQMHSPLLPYMHTTHAHAVKPPSYPQGYIKITEYDEEGWSQTVSLRDENERTNQSD